MLILTRRTGERIRIGNDIEVVVRRVSGSRVTLAIEAPRDISILRGELEQYTDQEKPASRQKTQTRFRCDQKPYCVVQGRISNDIDDIESPLTDSILR